MARTSNEIVFDYHQHSYTRSIVINRGVVALEHGGTPFRQIFLSRNGALANIVYHSQNADTEAFRQIKVTLYTKFVQLVLKKIVEIVATSCHIFFRLKCTKLDFRRGSAPDPAERAFTLLPRLPSWI